MMHIEPKTFSAAEQAAAARARRERLGIKPIGPTNAYAKIMEEKARKEQERLDMLEAKRRVRDEYIKAEMARIAAERDALKRLAMIEKEKRERSGEEAELRLKREMGERLPPIIAVQAVQADEEYEAMVESLKPRKKVSDIILEVMERHGFPFHPLEIIGPKRFRAIIPIRHECVYEVFIQRPDMSLPQIGLKFRRDHTSILHAIRAHKKRNGIPDTGVCRGA